MPGDDTVDGLKLQIAAMARTQIGAHYVWGGYGNIPGATRPDAHQFPGGFGRRARMWPNDPVGNRRDHGRSQPIMFTAFTEIGGRIYICGGRCNRGVFGMKRAMNHIQHVVELADVSFAYPGQAAGPPTR